MAGAARQGGREPCRIPVDEIVARRRYGAGEGFTRKVVSVVIIIGGDQAVERVGRQGAGRVGGVLGIDDVAPARAERRCAGRVDELAVGSQQDIAARADLPVDVDVAAAGRDRQVAGEGRGLIEGESAAGGNEGVCPADGGQQVRIGGTAESRSRVGLQGAVAGRRGRILQDAGRDVDLALGDVEIGGAGGGRRSVQGFDDPKLTGGAQGPRQYAQRIGAVAAAGKRSEQAAAGIDADRRLAGRRAAAGIGVAADGLQPEGRQVGIEAVGPAPGLAHHHAPIAALQLGRGHALALAAVGHAGRLVVVIGAVDRAAAVRADDAAGLAVVAMDVPGRKDAGNCGAGVQAGNTTRDTGARYRAQVIGATDRTAVRDPDEAAGIQLAGDRSG